MAMYKFEKLRVFHNAMDLLEEIYRIIKLLPRDERFALIDQLKRSSTSVVLNIAEGTGGLGDTEFKSFLRNALKSLYETVAGLKVATKLFSINTENALHKCETVGKELNALIKSLKTEAKKLD